VPANLNCLCKSLTRTIYSDHSYMV